MFEPRRGIRREPDGIAAQPAGARARGDHHVGRLQYAAPGGVEVVGVPVVGQQDRVYVAHLGGGQRRPGQLPGSRARAKTVRLAGRVEGGVGEQPPSLHLEENGRAADMGQASGAQAGTVAAECSRAQDRA